MKHLVTTTLAALSLGIATIPAQAQELVNEPAMMVYYSMPFGAKTRQQAAPTYGFRMDTLENEDGSTFSSFTGKPAMMDFALNQDGPKSLSFNGVNALIKSSVYNADSGETETTTAVDLGLVAIGIIGVIAITNNTDHDNDNCGAVTFQMDAGVLASSGGCAVGFTNR